MFYDWLRNHRAREPTVIAVGLYAVLLEDAPIHSNHVDDWIAFVDAHCVHGSMANNVQYVFGLWQQGNENETGPAERQLQ